MNNYPLLTIGDTRVQVLGDQHFGRRFITGVPMHRRGDREAAILARFEAHMAAIDCDIHVNMGDVFDKPVVHPRFVLMVANVYLKAMRKNPNTEFFIIEGNHDKGKDIEAITSFDLLARILSAQETAKVRVVQNFPFEHPEVDLLFVPWQGVITSAERVQGYESYPFDAVFGHWDVVAVSDTSNLVPMSVLKETKLFVTGHDHKRRELHDGKLLVTGSMEPYTHGEDWTGEMYRTVTLKELELISPEDRLNRCLRVVLAEGETLPADIDAYQVTVMREKQDGTMDLDVSLDGMDMDTIWADTFREFGVSEALSGTLFTKFKER